MFSKAIIDSDAFLEMPQSSQLLYFHLSMRADDDGFVNKPKSIMGMVGCKNDDLKILFSKRFIIPFDSGVVVIKHWRINNYIQKDRYHETRYQDEKTALQVEPNGAYKWPVSKMDTECIQDVSKMDTQSSLELGKDSNRELPDGNSSSESEPDSDPDVVQQVIYFYNQHNKNMPKATTCSKRRRGFIRARVQQYGIEKVKDVVIKAEQSDFLNGGGPKGWVASGLDWIMGPENFPKVLEGRYENRAPQSESESSGWEGVPDL